MEIDSALRKASRDDRIEKVLVKPGALAVGFAKVQELRDILTRFSTDSAKPVVCWMEMAGNKEYLLATACDEIWMAPEGFFLVNGLNLEVTFFKGTLDKIGVEAEFARAGKYKSAIEPLTSTGMSPAFREMLESLADSLYDDFVAAVAEARKMEPARVRDLIDDPPLTAAGAARAGLVDGLLYWDQILTQLGGESVQAIPADRPPLHLLGATPAALPAPDETSPAPTPPAAPADAALGAGDDDSASRTPAVATGEAARRDDDSASEPAGLPLLAGEREKPPKDWPEDELERVTLEEYRQTRPSSLGLGRGPHVAVVYCEGSITSGPSSPGGPLGSQSMGSDTIAAAIRKARKDEDIKAVVLRVDSPGGSGLASDVIWREVEQTRRYKPVVVSMSDYAASGGYYISMAADAIVAQPGTLTGSIGVFAGKYNLAGLYEKVGLTSESVERGAMSDLFDADEPLGEDGRNKLSQFIDEFYDGFVSRVAEGRRTSTQAVHEVAQGRVWTGAQGKAVGLVDELGSFRTALQIAKEKAGIEGEVKLVLLPRQPSVFEQLLGKTSPGNGMLGLLDRWVPLRSGLGSGAGSGAADAASAERALRHAFSLLPLFASGQPVAALPYHLEAR
jgi:protease-4